MKADNLIHMANQIGDFFQTMPDREEAQGMHDIVQAALRKHRADLQPATN